MRKILLLLTIIAVSLNSFAQHTVQGIPYNNPRKLYSGEKMTPPLLTSDAPFTFDDIQNWTGEGENQAAVVIQFNTGKDTETTAMVFGYRWDGEKTGADMIVAIAESDPRFYILANYGGYGYSIGGMGWDADEDGDNYLVNDDVRYDLVNGKYECSSEYDYDNFTAGDTDDFWAGGWFNGYWSYWISTSGPENFGYASTGASGRILTNGCWDGWNFYAGMSSYSWLPFAAAPSLIPEGATTEFKVNGIYYTLGSYQNKTVYVSAAKEMEDETLTAYTGEITIPASFTFDEVEYTVVGIDKNAFENTTITTITLPTTIAEIKDEAFKNSSLSAIDLQYVEKIGKYAFTGCRQLKNVALSSSVKKISEGTFSDSGITSISLENVTDKQELVYDDTDDVFKNKTTRVELTQAEYEQLVADDEVLPDVDYYITDAPSMQGSSADLSYDGTTKSVYTKIEEVASDVSDLGTNKANKTELPFVKYEEINVTLDNSGEGTLFTTNKYVVGIKDIPSDSLYVGYIVYFAGTLTKCKAFSRSALAFTSQGIVSMTRKIGVYYIDNISTT